MLKVSKILKIIKKSEVIVPIDSISNDEDDFEAMLKREYNCATASFEQSRTDLKLKLINLANFKTRLPSSTNIIMYWETQKYNDPELYELATVALSAPVTQVSVERCFSAVKLLLEQHRLRMSPDLLNDLMILRCNKDLITTAIAKLKHA